MKASTAQALLHMAESADRNRAVAERLIRLDETLTEREKSEIVNTVVAGFRGISYQIKHEFDGAQKEQS